MKKQVYKLGLVAFLGMSAMAFAQVQEGVVGINTESPNATLDVVTKTGADKSLRVENTSAVETVTVLNNGKIGINEVAPSERLEVGGNIKAKEGSLVSSREANSGGSIAIDNPLKSGSDMARRWRVWNMTGGYTNSLQFWTYSDTDSGVSRMMLTDDGKLAIGFERNYAPTEKLEVTGFIKSTELAGSGKRNVVADENGKLVVGDATGGASLDAITGEIKEVQHIQIADWTPGVFALIQTGNLGVELPDPASYKNRIIAVNNQYTNAIQYSSTNSPQNTSGLDSGKGHLLMSNGSGWYIIGGSY